MARRTQDREDLLNEATALNPRLLLQVELSGQAVELFAGFRKGTALSLYFDTEPVLHFNSQGELRRAFADGRLLKAEKGRLVSWKPQRSPTSAAMVRHELTEHEQSQFGQRVAAWTGSLQKSIAARQFTLLGQIPPESDVLDRLFHWLEAFTAFRVATLPNLR